MGVVDDDVGLGLDAEGRGGAGELLGRRNHVLEASAENGTGRAS